MTLRHLFLGLSASFWLGIGYYAVRCPHQETAGDLPSADAAGERPGILPGAGAIYRPLPVLRSEEVGRHNTPNDCWITLHGVVFNLSAYLPEHPDRKREIERYCGKDGSDNWDAKQSGPEKGSPHSDLAFQILAEYPRVGILKR